ncbi:MAG TPA: hypothetical protein PK402_05905 [Tepidisphaeraceae bacterium]|nr:hypothetical protein [Tepidisphaeraceae bacterium]
MAKRSSSTESKRNRRRGYTLGECMVASVLLAMSTASLSGVMAASYQHDRATTQSIQAVQSGQRLLEEIIAMPLTAGTGSSATILNYHNYVDVVDQSETASTIEQVDKTSSTSARTVPSSNPKATTMSLAANQVRRAVSVTRYATVGGTLDTSGNLYQVIVKIERSDGKVIRLSRLVTPAESGN